MAATVDTYDVAAHPRRQVSGLQGREQPRTQLALFHGRADQEEGGVFGYLTAAPAPEE